MSSSLFSRDVTVRQGAYLPHWNSDSAIYHTVFRLVDSLPASVVEEYRIERLALLAEAEAGNVSARERLDELFGVRIENFLDAGHGDCWLARIEVADVMAAALRYFDGQRYHLYAWCVMPNHVHAVVQPLGNSSLPEILHSWKSYTATAANRLLQQEGPFWQKESYDHLIRDAAEFERIVRYVSENPERAGLKQ